MRAENRNARRHRSSDDCGSPEAADLAGAAVAARAGSVVGFWPQRAVSVPVSDEKTKNQTKSAGASKPKKSAAARRK